MVYVSRYLTMYVNDEMKYPEINVYLNFKIL